MKIANCKLKIKKEDFWITKLLLYLTVFSAPLYVVRFRIGALPTTLLEVLILLTIVTWSWENRKNRHYYSLGGPVFASRNIPMLLFLLSASIAFLISSDKHSAFGIYKAYVIEPILIYLVASTVIETKKDADKLVAAMVGSGVFVSLWVISQAGFGWFISNPTEAMFGRAHGPYNTANAVGLYLGPIFALALPVILGRREATTPESKIKIQKKLLSYCVIVLLLLAILLSHSTGALIATTAVVLCFFLFNHLSDSRFTIYGLFTYCLLSLAFIFFTVPTLTPKTTWTRVRPENYTTTTIRLCLWEGTRNMLLDNPLFGAGLSGFKELYSEKYTTCDSEPLEYPHNLILNFWAEMGVLGLISFMWLVWKTLKKAPLGVILALMYILIHGLVDVPYFKNDLALQFWLLLALSDFQTKKSRAPQA